LHATLAHWTPDGWVINLGATWGWGRIENESDFDFLAMTQARKVEAAYLEVQRAQWVGAALGEKKAFGFHAAASGFWNGVALYRQRATIEKAKAVTLAAVGTDIGEANESKEKDVVKAVTVTEADKKIVVGQDGVITIPAVACSKPTNSTGRIREIRAQRAGGDDQRRPAPLGRGQRCQGTGRHRRAVHRRHVGQNPAGRSLAGQGQERPSLLAHRTGQGVDHQGFHVEAGEVTDKGKTKETGNRNEVHNALSDW
jgi:hypothetical protein